jgi:hypothetical protein
MIKHFSVANQQLRAILLITLVFIVSAYHNVLVAEEPTLSPIISASEPNYPPHATVTPEGQADGFLVELRGVFSTVKQSLFFTSYFQGLDCAKLLYS